MKAYIISATIKFKWNKFSTYLPAIKSLINKEISHSAVLYRFDGDINLILEADEPYVGFISYKSWANNKHIKVWHTDVNTNFQKGLDELDKPCRCKTKGLRRFWEKVKLFFSNLAKKEISKEEFTIFAKDTWSCSELVGYTFDIRNWSSLTPSLLDTTCDVLLEWKLLYEGDAKDLIIKELE